MEVQEKNLLLAYNEADESVKRMLKNLFPDFDFEAQQKDNRPVTERIKTFEDACRELGEKHPFVTEWNFVCEAMHDRNLELSFDTIAYYKLRIIVAALNEGWEPQFTEDELRYYPWFCLYTEEELAEKSEQWKKSHAVLSLGRVVGRSANSANAHGGLAYASTGSASSYSGTNIGSRLAFKSESVAEYAGKQFIEIYADFHLIRCNENEEM